MNTNSNTAAIITGIPAELVPVSTLRKTALVAGVLYLLTFVSIPTLALYRSIHAADYVTSAGPDTAAVIGGLLEIIVALAGIGTAIALYPVLRRQSEGLALGFGRLPDPGSRHHVCWRSFYFINSNLAAVRRRYWEHWQPAIR